MVGEFNDNNLKGIIPRSFDYIFQRIEENHKKDPSERYNISIAFIQIYLETIQDLFELKNQVKIREDPDKGVFLENCMWIKIRNTKECGEAFKKGEKNRNTECTRMNAHSSRSHALLIAKIEKNFEHKTNKEHLMTSSYLYLVDLAGSERVNKTNAKLMRLEEAKKINYSLLVLGNCIQSLTDNKSSHVSYRDSKLTRLLQESLGGNAKTSLIVTISPSNYNAEETVSSLNFAVRAMKVQNKPTINKTEDYQAQLIKLQEDFDKLQEKYSKLKIDYENILEENQKFKNGETYIDLQRKSIKNRIQKGMKEEDNKNLDENEIKEESMRKLNEDFKKMETFYRDLIEKKTMEFQNTFKQIEIENSKKEQENENLKNEINKLNQKIKDLEGNNLDLKNTNEGLQNSLMDALSKNEELTNQLSKYNQKNEINKSNNYRNISIQTEQIFKDEIKKKLLNLNIKMSDIIENKFYDIIIELLNFIDKIKDGNILFGGKYGMIINSNNNTKINKEEISIKEYNKMKKKIKEMEEQIDVYEKKFDKAVQEKVNQIKNEYQLKQVNNALEENDARRLQINSFANQKNLLRELSGLENDLSNFQRIKKQIQKLDIMLNADIPNRCKEKNFDQTLIRIDEELNKGQGMLEDIASSPTVYKNIRDKKIGIFQEIIDKLHSSLKENKIIFTYMINYYMRLSKNYYNIYKNKNNEIPMTNDEINELENKKQNQILDDLKLQLIKNLKQNIDEFAHLIEQNNINELNNYCLDLKNNCDKMNIIEVFQKACEILYNLISKFSVYKSEKENQINNLSNQVFYLLKEKEKALNKEESKFDNSEIDEKTQKKISMKEEEVKQLKEVIQSLNSSKNDLSKENAYLKQQISEIYSEFQNKNNSNIILSIIEKINKNRENIEKTDEELIKIKNMYNEYGYIKNILNKNKNLEKRLERNFSDRSRSKGKKK